MKRVSVLLAGIALVLAWAGIAQDVHAASASLYLSPSSKSVTVGSSFSVALYVSTDTAMNAAQATVTFPSDILQVTSMSTDGIFTLWAETPKHSNTAGTVTFAGGLPSPGYKGKSGKILTVTFKAWAAGKPKVSITKGSVLANDANATELLRSQGSGTYTVTKPAPPPPTNQNTNTQEPPPPPGPPPAPVISSPTQANQVKWYSKNDVMFVWQNDVNARGYSVVFDISPDTVPTDVVTTEAASYTREGVPDGVWYLHVRAKYDAGWSSTTTFVTRIDATPPELFSLNIIGDPRVEFSATDATSGVDHYEVSLDGGEFATVTSPYQTPTLPVGMHSITVRAYDKAGNYREAASQFEILAYPQPIVIDLTPVAVGNEPIIMRGFANAQDSLRLTIDGVEYGPYPVAEHLDPEAPEKPPEGMVAWKIEIVAGTTPGEHEVTVSAVGTGGEVSPSTVPVRFRVAPNAVRILGRPVSMVIVINVLILLVGILLCAVTLFAFKYFRLRHRLRHASVDMLSPAAGGDHRPTKPGPVLPRAPDTGKH